MTDTDRARQMRNLINRRVATAPEQFLRLLERLTRTLEIKRLGGVVSEDRIARALRDIESALSVEDAEEFARIEASKKLP